MDKSNVTACQGQDYCKAALDTWTVSHATSYRRMQVPLRALKWRFNGGKSPTAADFRQGIDPFGMGGAWQGKSVVDFDALAIWY